MGEIKFVAMLYVVALASLFLGGSALFVKVRFKLGSEHGVMTSSDPNLIRAAKYAPNDSMQADVVYATSTGPLAVHNQRLSAEDVQRLARGEGYI